MRVTYSMKAPHYIEYMTSWNARATHIHRFKDPFECIQVGHLFDDVTSLNRLQDPIECIVSGH